ncbi:MAG: alcohol dehydrogenase catalytic domain-containing protein [Intrasporangium sp.]|uniref:zinc-dependent alcohol dehydrogenase n=1 Tax=Intrasporangium sp. TaxID=1925024 RepID=UPI002649F0CE|nr:alcohol dehydrogenase catalytic domain-containing protein [Intrasporangium sp.]MDN5798138.1 alcohol dehydrogenase catalytic domain-containing protein [Intrasporangium sp.]
MARVRVAATGICGTDLHIARDEYACEPPVVMGHEVSGVVDAVGRGGDAALVGARVVLETYYSTCGRCDWCRTGRINLCPRRRSIGSFENGGFAPFLVVPQLNLHVLPGAVGSVEGALAEPLACVTQCLMDPSVVDAGDRVLVTGPGAMGQLAAQVAVACGGSVTVAGLAQDRERLDVAAGLGMNTTAAPAEENSFDVVIECSGSGAAAGAAMHAARRGARYVQVGIFGREVALPFDLVLYKELVVSSGFASTPASWRRAMTLITDGAVRLEPLVTRRVPLNDWAVAFEAARSGEGIKTVVIP